MRGSFFLGAETPKKFEVRDMSFKPVEKHDVLIRVHACGVCGTDVHIYHGEEGSAPVNPPVVLGHEFSGEVVEIGSEVNNVEVGDHVTLDPNMYCGMCMPCKMGKKQNCKHLFALGVNVNGGFAEYAIAPDKQCYKLKKTLDYNIGAMAEPLACAIHGIDKAGIVPGNSVLIVGGGTIGLFMVQLARLSGASTIVISEPIEMRRRIALEIGADYAIDPIHSNVATEMRNYVNSDGADIVIECVGKPFAAEQAFQAAGSGATIVFFSVPATDSKVQFPMFDIYKKELTIRGSIINPDTHQRAVNLLNSDRLIIDKLITHHYDLEHLEDAILMQMSNESIKVVVNP